MDKFPPEITCSIFLLSLPRREERRGSTAYSFMKKVIVAPVRISHVCRAWRSIALAYGRLWNHLFVKHDCWFRCGILPGEIMTEMVEMFLSRSGDYPLSIHFDCDLRYDATAEDHRFAEQVIKALCSHQHRWEHVDFNWDRIEVSREFPALSLTNMPKLVNFKFHSRVWRENDTPVRVKVDIARSPKLRDLDFDGDHELVIGEPAHRPLLRSCKLSFFHLPMLQVCKNLLTSTPALEEFRADIFGPDLSSDSHFWDDPHLFLPHLRVLEVMLSTSVPIIDRLTLPSLSKLAFYDESEIGGERLLNFIGRSRPPLTSLSLLGERINEDTLGRILRALPLLECLEITEAMISRRFFVELIVKEAPEEQVLCPALKTLLLPKMWLQEGEEDGTTFDTILCMMMSRKEAFGTCDQAYYEMGDYDTIEIDMSNIDSLGQSKVTLPGTRLCVRTYPDVINEADKF